MKGLAALPLLSLIGGESWALDSKGPEFSFVYVCDIHLTNGVPDNGYKMLQESQLFFQDIIKGINALNPDFVIFGGDQVEGVGKNDANWQFFVDVAQGLQCPWYFVFGEDDISGKSPVDKLEVFGPDLKGRGLGGATTYWSCDPLEKVHLIGLDSSQANSNTGDISEEQLNWLKQDLKNNKGKFTIVACHHPLLPPAPYDGGPPFDEYIVPNGADVRETLGTSRDVRLVLSGHLYLNKIQLERDVYHVSSAGLDIYPCQYKYFGVTKDAIVMESYSVSLDKLVKKAKSALAESPLATKISRRKPEAIIELCEGRAEDQNAYLTLAATKAIKELSKKQVKEDQDKQQEELAKIQEEARNKGKGKKGKKSKGSKDSKAKDSVAKDQNKEDQGKDEKSKVEKAKKSKGSAGKNKETEKDEGENEGKSKKSSGKSSTGKSSSKSSSKSSNADSTGGKKGQSSKSTAPEKSNETESGVYTDETDSGTGERTEAGSEHF